MGEIAREQAAENPLLVSTVVSLAAFMEVLDTTIANVALNNIAGSLGASADESTWVLTSYLVANGIVLPLSGWLSGLMGRKAFFITCIVGFTTASFMCGVATSLPMLIVCRILQGLAGGGLQPSQQAIIKDSFPPEKLAMAFAITGITTVMAPIVGPTLGGYITDNYSWRWIFFINVPVGVLAAVLVKMLVSDPPTARRRDVGRIDYIGLGLIAVGLGCLQVMLDKGNQEDWWDSPFIVVMAGLAAFGILASIAWLWRRPEPVVKLDLFRSYAFASSNLMIFFVGFVLYSGSVLLPMLVQADFGYDATTAGLVLSPGGILLLLLMPLTARVVNRVEPRYLIAAGMLLVAAGLAAGALITPQTDYVGFVGLRILQVLGLPLIFISATTLAFAGVPAADSSNASAIVSLMRNIGGSVGIALVTNRMIHSQQIEQTALVANLTGGNPGYGGNIAAISQYLVSHGMATDAARAVAHGAVYRELAHQASVLAFRDAYAYLAIIAAVLAGLALLMPRCNLRSGSSPAEQMH
ncbi:MAG: DHA2 family efflux MFS transporter permease subunit [Negativicutes bacterium]|nr:DHA2 family efflux MFS transporter permease subunit [Negativicutes bacterium]